MKWVQFCHSLALPFFGIGIKTDIFQSCGHCWVFKICWHIEWSTLTTSCFHIWNSLAGMPSPPVALSIVMLPKAHSTSHSKMFGSRWVIKPLWLSGSVRSRLLLVKWKEVCSSSARTQNYNSLQSNHQQENVGSHQKKIPHIQGQRRSPRKTVEGVKSHLESNPIPARDTRRAQTKLWVHRDPETPRRLSQKCLWVFEYLLWRNSSARACPRGGVTGFSRPGCRKSVLGRGCH